MSDGPTGSSSWDAADAFFSRLCAESPDVAWMAAIDLALLRGARARWSSQLDCAPVVGIATAYYPRGAPGVTWVRVEPRRAAWPDETVAVSLHDRRRPDGASTRTHALRGPTVGGTVCRLTTAPAVLESYLLQLGDEDEADARHPWP